MINSGPTLKLFPVSCARCGREEYGAGFTRVEAWGDMCSRGWRVEHPDSADGGPGEWYELVCPDHEERS